MGVPSQHTNRQLLVGLLDDVGQGGGVGGDHGDGLINVAVGGGQPDVVAAGTVSAGSTRIV